MTARCSYGIWLMRNSRCWNASRTLVIPNSETFVSPPPICILPELSFQPNGSPLNVDDLGTRLDTPVPVEEKFPSAPVVEETVSTPRLTAPVRNLTLSPNPQARLKFSSPTRSRNFFTLQIAVILNPSEIVDFVHGLVWKTSTLMLSVVGTLLLE